MRYSSLAILLLIHASLGAQNLTPKIVQGDQLIKSWAAGDRSVGQRMVIMPPAPGTKVSEVYVDTHWKRSRVALYGNDNLIDGFPVKYDLRANSLEFIVDKEVKVLDVRKVKSMIWLDSLSNYPHNFVNGKEFTLNQVPLTTLLEVLAEGKLNLYKQFTYWIRPPDFNPALNSGSPDERIFITEHFLYSADKMLSEVPSKKKALPAIFGDQAAAVKNFMKERDLSASKENDLIAIFEFYNAH